METAADAWDNTEPSLKEGENEKAQSASFILLKEIRGG